MSTSNTISVGATTSSCVSDTPERSGNRPMGRVVPARLVVKGPNNNFRVPSKVAIEPYPSPKALDGPPACKMVFGFEVDQGVEDGRIHPDDVFDLLKYALHPDYSVGERDRRYAGLDQILKDAKKRHTALCKKIKEQY